MNLSEPAGLGDAASRQTVWAVNGAQRSALARGPLDFNGVGDVTDTGLAADLNHLTSFGRACGSSPGQQLVVFDDWGHLDFNFRDSGDFADFRHDTALELEEQTQGQIAANTDSDGDGVPDSVDNCAGTVNGDQYKRDADALGDACDPDSDPPTIDLISHEDGARVPAQRHRVRRLRVRR